ncbi:hypothetical protein CM15mP5_0960 [bacterium]|nr:MAG: hypothetical protein CM15mP5_0960 [bacterium]
MVPFSGWEMAVQFEGLIKEHKTVRESVGCLIYLIWVL